MILFLPHKNNFTCASLQHIERYPMLTSTFLGVLLPATYVTVYAKTSHKSAKIYFQVRDRFRYFSLIAIFLENFEPIACIIAEMRYGSFYSRLTEYCVRATGPRSRMLAL